MMMKKICLTVLYSIVCFGGVSADPIVDGPYVLKRLDANMTAATMVMDAKMIVYTIRNDREMQLAFFYKTGAQSFVEYLSPERDKGTKMLKLSDRIWIYSPSIDRTIQIAGHMLRQSMMGSDMSYEDMMERDGLNDKYQAEIQGEETMDGRPCWVLSLTAKEAEDVAYQSRKIWVDKDRYAPLCEELYAKSGQLLKRTVLSDIRQFGKRWFPMKLNYKDMLKTGKGTDLIILSVSFDTVLSEAVFTKANLTR